jgi:hypothetical protein
LSPPAYPTRVLMTPWRLPNRESEPQNQPNANVAVSVTDGLLVSIGGFVLSIPTIFTSSRAQFVKIVAVTINSTTIAIIKIENLALFINNYLRLVYPRG